MPDLYDNLLKIDDIVRKVQIKENYIKHLITIPQNFQDNEKANSEKLSKTEIKIIIIG